MSDNQKVLQAFNTTMLMLTNGITLNGTNMCHHQSHMIEIHNNRLQPSRMKYYVLLMSHYWDLIIFLIASS